MDLVKLSKDANHERFSFGWKFSETSRIKFGKAEQGRMKKSLDELRKSNNPDKGVFIDLSGTLRLSEDSKKQVLFIVSDVAKNNIIGCDIYCGRKMSPEVKSLVEEISLIIKKTNTKAVELKKCREENQVVFWKIFFIILGVVLVVGGQFMSLSKSEFKDYFKLDTNMVQILGACSFFFGILPTIIKYKNVIFNKGANNNDSITD